MHHKRRRAKHRRAGCLMCKSHKDDRRPKTTRYKGLRGPRKAAEVKGEFGITAEQLERLMAPREPNAALRKAFEK